MNESALVEAIKMEEQVLMAVQSVISSESRIGAEARYGGCLKFREALLRDILISLNDGCIVVWNQHYMQLPWWIKTRFALADPKCFDNLSINFERLKSHLHVRREN